MGRPYTINVHRETGIPTAVYIQDAVKGFISLKQADESSLCRRIYNIHGFSLSAGNLVDVVKKHIPEARLSFRPDPAVVSIINSWPTLDDTKARQEWGWKPECESVEEYVKDFISEIRANPVFYQ